MIVTISVIVDDTTLTNDSPRMNRVQNVIEAKAEAVSCCGGRRSWEERFQVTSRLNRRRIPVYIAMSVTFPTAGYFRHKSGASRRH
jgi:hypothetical protein